MCVCLCVCVCVREREREREKESLLTPTLSPITYCDVSFMFLHQSF